MAFEQETPSVCSIFLVDDLCMIGVLLAEYHFYHLQINMYFLEVFVGIVRTCGELIRNTRINLYGQSGEVGISIKRNSFKLIL